MSEFLEFERLSNAVVEEIAAYPEVWVRERKDLHMVAARLLAIDAPPMELISGDTLARLGRLPSRGERDEHGSLYTITLNELVATDTDLNKINIKILSHVRHSDASADDELHSKALVAAQFTDYERAVYQTTNNYWWIDSVCCDCGRSAAHTAALPLYIAAGAVVSFYDTHNAETYLSRAWTRLEVLLSAALHSPRHWRLVSPHLFDAATLRDSERVVLLDPMQGVFARESDREYVQRLTALAQQMWVVGRNCNWFSEGNTYSEWNVPEQLVLGESTVFTWNMNHYFGDDDDEEEEQAAAGKGEAAAGEGDGEREVEAPADNA